MGYRMQIHKVGKVTIFTRNGHNWTDRFPLVLFVCAFNGSIDDPRHIGRVIIWLQEGLLLVFGNNLLLILDRDKLFAFHFWSIRLGSNRNEGRLLYGLRGGPHGSLRREDGVDHIDGVTDGAGDGISVQIIEPRAAHVVLACALRAAVSFDVSLGGHSLALLRLVSEWQQKPRRRASAAQHGVTASMLIPPATLVRCTMIALGRVSDLELLDRLGNGLVERAREALKEFQVGARVQGVLASPHVRAASLKWAQEELRKAIAIIERTKWR